MSQISEHSWSSRDLPDNPGGGCSEGRSQPLPETERSGSQRISSMFCHEKKDSRWGFKNWGVVTRNFRRRQWHPTPVLLPGKSHGRKSLVGCSPWGHEESDMNERLHFHFSLLCIEEGNGNPLQCSCLESLRDGVTQCWTRLKWLSSSSNQEFWTQIWPNSGGWWRTEEPGGLQPMRVAKSQT